MSDKNQSLGYMEIFKSTSLTNYHVHHNATCIKCDVLEKEMVRVGAVIFCEGCVIDEFKSEDPVREERETYLKWLRKSHGED